MRTLLVMRHAKSDWDADYGADAQFRAGLERLGLRYGVAIRSDAKCTTADVRRLDTVAVIADAARPDEWLPITWGTGTDGPLTAAFYAVRVRQPQGRGERWLLAERSSADVRKYYLLNLPATATLVELVALARSR